MSRENFEYNKETKQFLEALKEAPDAVSYLEANKKVIVPAEKIKEAEKARHRKLAGFDLPENPFLKPGFAWMAHTKIEFIDDEGNLAEADIDLSKIESVNSIFDEEKRKEAGGLLNRHLRREFFEELKKNDFDLPSEPDHIKQRQAQFDQFKEECLGEVPVSVYRRDLV